MGGKGPYNPARNRPFFGQPLGATRPDCARSPQNSPSGRRQIGTRVNTSQRSPAGHIDVLPGKGAVRAKSITANLAIGNGVKISYTIPFQSIVLSKDLSRTTGAEHVGGQTQNESRAPIRTALSS